MEKRMMFIAYIAIILVVFTQNNTLFYKADKKVRYNLPKANTIVTVSKSVEPFKVYFTPTVDNLYIGFKEAIAFKESRGNYKKVNSLGYLGKYQFGESTLNRIRIYDTENFLNDPELQEEAFYTLCSLNKWILKRDIKRSVGKKINGVVITESGILAAAHLAGAGNVKKYLRSNGEINSYDAYGTNVHQYMKKFAGYDTSFIKPVKNARI
ncbi:peptidoglycan-binding protein LysM [Lutimonas zeaxanthinifaciens]|uniref:peptidoglycan-binding protein LysM n=1 Tax=Lutimonas zeaxanthinifaciens TaxID=3060215 RepID=UPI00265D51CA|nr:peptidoglycan-binding protein LysM [Lutimonas sp. YSD2104]WKK65031.1 peptidoglycan-binding protein LysM [Lutimonas sp. YSD2104]